MKRKKLPVRFTGQHFTIDNVLIEDAIKKANITQHDTVLDIGAGKGFVTAHLVQNAKRVVAIEIDLALSEHLRKKFGNVTNVSVANCDFRRYSLPNNPFKVVSNIPYGITSEIFRRLMFDNVENFVGGAIVLQLEPAKKLFSSTLFNPYTVFYQTFYDIKLVYEVSPGSFYPPPTVMSALITIARKQQLFDLKLKAEYLGFLFLC